MTQSTPLSVIDTIFSKVSNWTANKIVISGVPVTMPTANSMDSNAFGLAASQYVSKVTLAADNVYFNTDQNGSHFPNFKNLPWISKQFIDFYPSAIDKIFASDGITPAQTAITGVADSASAISLLEGSHSSHIYGVQLADMQTAYTTFDSFKTGMKVLGTTANLVVIDTPASLFDHEMSYYGGTFSHTTFQIKDSAANIHAHIEALNAHPSQVDSIVFTDPTTSVASSGGLMLDGSNGHSVFKINAALAANPTIAIDTLNGWSGDDVIQYSSLLKIVQNTASAGTGMAHIDSNGYATFVSNSESLDQQIMDVEGALASSNGLPQAGTVVKWDGSGADANNSFVLITGNHATAGDTSHDQVIKIVGVDASHVQVAAGVVVHHS
jgi:hypothetical protein